MAKKKVLKLAFIGGGGIARQHADYFSRHDDVNIAAVADISDDCLKHWKDALEVPGYTAYQEMLQEVKPDLVSICTPNFLHYKPSFIPETDIWETKFRGVIDHMLHNGPNLAPAEDGLAMQQILDGIYRSARTGREVAVR